MCQRAQSTFIATTRLFKVLHAQHPPDLLFLSIFAASKPDSSMAQGGQDGVHSVTVAVALDWTPNTNHT
jgi:hypothetical protein